MWLGLNILLLLLCLNPGVNVVEGSVHKYVGAKFSGNGNAFLLYGGSEGLRASSSSSSSLGKDVVSGVNDGRSFIRLDNITFHRKKEIAAQDSNMDHDTGLVQVLIFEAADRDNIGGSPYGGQKAICCTPDLSKLENCKQGEVIWRPSAKDATWPYVTSVRFHGDAQKSPWKL